MESENKQFCLKKSNPKGQRSGLDILAAYAEKGIISTETYKEMLDRYGAIEKRQKTHEDVSFPKKAEESISIETDNEIIEKYGTMIQATTEKKKTKKTQKIKNAICSITAVLVLFVSMLGALGYILERDGKGVAVLFVLLWLWAFHHVSKKQ